MKQRTILRNQTRGQLLGPDGNPIASKKDTEIPFVRYKGEKRSLHTIDRGPKMYAEALPFLARGGQFVCQITPWGKAQLVAGISIKGGAKGELAIVAEEIVPNNEGAIMMAVDRLVRAALHEMDRVILGESQGTLQ